MISLAVLTEAFAKGVSIAVAAYALWREYKGSR